MMVGYSFSRTDPLCGYINGIDTVIAEYYFFVTRDRMVAMKDYFISDPHFGHRLVSRLRGFDDPYKHDRYLYEQWMDKLPSNERIRLWMLGDLYCGKPPAEEKALRFIAQFRDDLLSRKNTDMWMEALLGNHDQAHPMKRNNLRSLRNFNRVFDSVQTVARYSLNGSLVMLHHFPYSGDYEPEKTMQFRLHDLGQTLIHGHTHSGEQISWSDKGTLQVNVGVEACPGFAPMSSEEVAKVIAEASRQKPKSPQKQ